MVRFFFKFCGACPQYFWEMGSSRAGNGAFLLDAYAARFVSLEYRDDISLGNKRFRAHTVSLQIVDLVRKAAGGCVNAGMEKPIAAKSARRLRYYTSYPMPFFETLEDGRGGRLVDGRLIYP
jgi:hypothetical protein